MNRSLYYSRFKVLAVLFFSLILYHNAWAAQDAYVVAERAIVYADEKMTSPVGFVSRGKKIRVGDIPRNKAQVYPVIVSGKMAFIRTTDINTQKESMNSDRLVAERFIKSTKAELKSRYSLSYLNYSSQVTLSNENTDISNKDVLNWQGVSLKGEALMTKKWELQVLTNYLSTSQGRESFKVLELGLGTGYRILDKSRLLVRIEGQLMFVPFSTYSFGSDFRVRGFGFSTGGALNVAYRLSEHWGVEGFAGLYWLKLSGFNVPSPYKKINPSFLGNRMGIGVFYQF